MDAILLLIIIVGLVQLPILTDVLHHLFPQSRIPRLAARATKPIFVCLFVASCVLALHLFYQVFLPNTIHTWRVETTWTGVITCVLLSLLANYFILNMVCYYVSASFCSASTLKTVRDTDMQLMAGETDSSYCQQCQLHKTSRIHHCRVCARCCVLMDHHCPFTANCVGRDNMRDFYLWLTYCTVGLVYSCTLSYPAFHHCILYRSSLLTIESIDSPWSLPYCKSLSNSIWTFVLVGFGLVSVGVLWSIQTYLIHIDMTTLECIAWLGKDHSKKTHKEKQMEEAVDESVIAHSLSSSNGLSSGLSKSWLLIHRGQPMYRLLLPDFFWNSCTRLRLWKSQHR